MRESQTPVPEPDHLAAATDHCVPSRLVRALAGALVVEAALVAAAAVVLLVDLVRTRTAGGSDDGAGTLIGMTVFLTLCAKGLFM